MSTNDYLVIAADVLNKACLAALGASAIGVQLAPVVSLVLLVLAAATGTILTHLPPVGAQRPESS